MTQPAPPVDDPALAGLTFDQLAQLVEGESPDALYRQAAAFDGALLRMHDLQAEILRESRQMSELWDGQIAEAFDSFAAELTGGVDKIIQTMENPGHGALLRRAGEALTLAQQRFRELRAQPGHEADNRPALQIMHDLSVAYQEAGGAMTTSPDFVRRLPGAVADQQGATGGGAATGGASPVLATTGPMTGAATAGPAHGDWAVPGAGSALGVAAMTAGPAAPVAGGTTAGGVGGGVGAHGDRNPGVLGRSAPMAAQAAPQLSGRAESVAGPAGGGLFGALGRGRSDKRREREKRTFAVSQEGTASPQDAVEDARRRAAGVSTTSSVPDAVGMRSFAPVDTDVIPAVATTASPVQVGVPGVASASTAASVSTGASASPTASASTPAGVPVPASGPAQPFSAGPVSGSSGSGAAPLSLSSGSVPSGGGPSLPVGPVSAGGGTPAVPPVSRLDSALPGPPAPLLTGAPSSAAAAGAGAPMMPMGMMGRGMGAETGAEGRDPDVPIGAGPEVWDSGAGAAVLGRRPRQEAQESPEDLMNTNDLLLPGWANSGRIDGRKS
ncbi:hypothetical protein DMC64_37035 [Amycolatopsis sp. WAC 04197]|uniref:WXG100 family type VII secretion target n=1 Tax=Amycolatopsis sp. WAC 04197 TaxID=2203199 RepID=UPI000F766C45|nr:WXG100 family type VII secretion target [Amycolatopsis sp. WAC 04197]RSN39926.1 hypothetical protein DMC64_37035 [Amycolatopsis sp. WAC 04197]